jgi:hypothetical protein
LQGGGRCEPVTLGKYSQQYIRQYTLIIISFACFFIVLNVYFGLDNYECKCRGVIVISTPLVV